ncbi:helix-turn-helix domain-containing protein [Humidisolicoccus flavus]|uniref:helix-turn-helix domain-containing protein n=1 Tax=Humidisolicoccus flavus TaxID=3111414 RepID=UPI00324FC353
MNSEPQANDFSGAVRFINIQGELREFRTSAKISEQSVAENLGWDVRALRRFEAGATDPRLTELWRYALAVGVDIRIQVLPASFWDERCECFPPTSDRYAYGFDEAGRALERNPYCSVHFAAAPGLAEHAGLAEHTGLAACAGRADGEACADCAGLADCAGPEDCTGLEDCCAGLADCA